MTTAPPAMPGLRAFGPEGPFPATSQPMWVRHRAGLVRCLDLSTYGEEQLLAGADADLVAGLLAGVQRHGGDRVLWARGQGGRRGKVNASWDVQIVVSDSPFADLLRDVPQQDAPDGSVPVEALAARPEVLETYSAPIEPEKGVLPREACPTWARWLRVKMQVELLHERMAGAELGIGNVLVGMRTTSRSRLAAEDALVRLVEVVAYDLTRTVRAPSV